MPSWSHPDWVEEGEIERADRAYRADEWDLHVRHVEQVRVDRLRDHSSLPERGPSQPSAAALDGATPRSESDEKEAA